MRPDSRYVGLSDYNCGMSISKALKRPYRGTNPQPTHSHSTFIVCEVLYNLIACETITSIIASIIDNRYNCIRFTGHTHIHTGCTHPKIPGIV